MKTKFKLNLGGFTINTNTTVVRNDKGEVVEATAIPVEVPAISIEGEVEYTAGEMLDMWNVTKTVAKEAPEVFKNLAIDFVKAYYEAEEVVMPMHEERDNASC